jgi:uncharacterized repeat protein (TIGR01451 family)
VTGSASNGGPKAGTAFTYTWQVKNGGNQAANGESFTDTLPPGVIFQSVSTNLGTCTGPAVGSAGGTVSCSLSSLPAGQAQVVTLGVQAGTTVGTVANTGSATFAGTDTKPANNSFTVNVQVQ